MEQRCAECNCGEGPCNWILAPKVQLRSACNALSLMEMGMSETAAVRTAKQWEDKCAEVAMLRTALYDAREFVDAYRSTNEVWAKDRLERIDAALRGGQQ